MSWSCALALVEEFSARGCLVTASLERARSIRSAERSSCVDRKTGRFHRSRSGTTCEPSLDRLSMGALMSSPPASPAPPSAQPATRSSGTTTSTCGPRLSESFVTRDPDTSSWRTFPDLFGTSEEFSGDWPTSGSMRSGVCYERLTLVPPTDEPGSSSLLPTPTAGDAKNSGSRDHGTTKVGTTLTDEFVRTGEEGLLLNPQFVEWMMGFPTDWTACVRAGTESSPSSTPPPGDC